jgi:hypothetical protein
MSEWIFYAQVICQAGDKWIYQLSWFK